MIEERCTHPPLWHGKGSALGSTPGYVPVDGVVSTSTGTQGGPMARRFTRRIPSQACLNLSLELALIVDPYESTRNRPLSVRSDPRVCRPRTGALGTFHRPIDACGPRRTILICKPLLASPEQYSLSLAQRA
jgi:hypothetical protein